MFLDIIFLLAGFVILIYGANFLVDGGAALAQKLRVSPIVIGLTIVAFGTSAPELVVSVISAVKGSSALALSNVLGSNIFNILCILGTTALIAPLGVKRSTTWIEIPLTVIAALLILVMVMDEPLNTISRPEGIILLLFFIVFVTYTVVLAKRTGSNESEETPIKTYSTGKCILYIAIGLTGLLAGGQLLVTGAVNIAYTIGISERIIGLTIVSVGTSLPELATSIIAARKKNTDIAIGNIVGSNLFNTFLILGSSATILPLNIPQGSLADIWLNIIASLLLFIFIFTGKGRKISRWEGGIFLAIYIIYVISLILSNGS